ncbi:hypothetical protein Plhal304r1_c011g0044531 [Plasmopara halstedii]
MNSKNDASTILIYAKLCVSCTHCVFFAKRFTTVPQTQHICLCDVEAIPDEAGE